KDGFNTLVSIGPGGELRDESHRHPDYTALGYPAACGAHEKVAFVASGGQQPTRIITIDFTGDAAPQVRRRSDAELIRPAALSKPEPVSWTSFDGETAHGLYYPPA